MNKKKNIRVDPLHYRKLHNILQSIPATVLLGFFSCFVPHLSAQPSPQSPPQVTLESTLSLYLVTNYGDGGQEIDQYRATGDGEYIAFVLKTDKKLDMTQYLDKEELGNLAEYAGETTQSRFMLVPTAELAESFSGKDFAARYAHKRVRVTGTLFFSLSGWHYETPVAMEFSRVEVVESNYGVMGKETGDTLDSMKYYYDFEFREPEVHAYVRELTRFAETLLHDENTFKTDLSKKLDELRIMLQTSPDGKLKIYSWHDGDEGSAMNYHSIYQTYRNDRFHAMFMEDYIQEPRAVYQVETPQGPVYLVQYYYRESGWAFYIGVDAFTINDEGELHPANVFECVPEIHYGKKGYTATFEAECSHSMPPSLFYPNAWSENLSFKMTGRDFYLPQFVKTGKHSGNPYNNEIVTDFYHRFTWNGEKFQHQQLVFNPVLAKYLSEGWLKEEFELENSLARIDSVADGSYRYIVWNKDKMFSAAPDKVFTNGGYNAEK